MAPEKPNMYDSPDWIDAVGALPHHDHFNPRKIFDHFRPRHRREDLHAQPGLTPAEQIDQGFQSLLEKRRKVNAGEYIDAFKKDIHLEEYDPEMRVAVDPLGVTYPDRNGKYATYPDKLKETERKSGLVEAASYGIGVIDGREVVFANLDMRFMGGSVGRVATEKILRAIEVARGEREVVDEVKKRTDYVNDEDSADVGKKRKTRPLVILWNSGGMRQQEGFDSLPGMTEMVREIKRFREETDEPYLSVLCDVFGGTSASIIWGDIVIGQEGTDVGFAGGRVIENFQKKKIRPGSQSVEKRMLQTRQVDVIVKNEKEAFAYCRQALRVLKGDVQSQNKHRSQEEESHTSAIGFSTDLPKDFIPASVPSVEQVVFPSKSPGLYEQFNKLLTGVERPDTDYLIKQWFGDNYVPLYSKCQLSNGILVYPAIIGAYGRGSDGELYLVLGNMPTMKISGQSAYRLNTSPTPDDYKFVNNKLKRAQRFNPTVIIVVDTPGANATEDSEDRGIAFEIASSIEAGVDSSLIAIGVDNGVHGSGGAEGLGGPNDGNLVTEYSQLYVADPNAIATIVTGKAEPDQQVVKKIIETSGVDPVTQMHMGNVDGVIKSPPQGADKNPAGMARNIWKAIQEEKAKIEFELAAYGNIPHSEALKKRRNKRSRTKRNRAGIPLLNA